MGEMFSTSTSERRSFLTRISSGLAAFAATAFATGSVVQAQSTGSAWKPERHAKDDWFDQVPGKHRMVFDTTDYNGLGRAMGYANNFIRVNRTDYGLQNNDVAVVMILRAGSTSFAFNDMIWGKYGKIMAERINFVDPKSKMSPSSNLYNSENYGNSLSNRGTTIESLTKQGVQLAVCSVATRGIAGAIAEAMGAKTDDINAELVANILPSARMVPAGIVAVNRAQERGYSFVSA
jgi:intracellular sulfur oxidation DsrE/DsrF family protein